jgi:myo-inositol catabolism protein IolC
MPTATDMAEWYLEIKRSQLGDLVRQHNATLDQIKALEQHIIQCEADLSKEKKNDGNTIFGSAIPDN